MKQIQDAVVKIGECTHAKLKYAPLEVQVLVSYRYVEKEKLRQWGEDSSNGHYETSNCTIIGNGCIPVSSGKECPYMDDEPWEHKQNVKSRSFSTKT